MTCIVGIQHRNGVTIGADSASTSGTRLLIRADEKMFIRDGYVFGFTSSYRMGQLLRYAVELPKPPKRDLDEFMVTKFIDAVRSAFKDGGYMYTNNGREESGAFLVGVTGRLFAVHSDHQIARPATGYTAVGCGDELAAGSLHTSAALRVTDPVVRARLALAAAAAASSAVAGPFHIRTLANA